MSELTYQLEWWIRSSMTLLFLQTENRLIYVGTDLPERRILTLTANRLIYVGTDVPIREEDMFVYGITDVLTDNRLIYVGTDLPVRELPIPYWFLGKWTLKSHHLYHPSVRQRKLQSII